MSKNDLSALAKGIRTASKFFLFASIVFMLSGMMKADLLVFIASLFSLIGSVVLMSATSLEKSEEREAAPVRERAPAPAMLTSKPEPVIERAPQPKKAAPEKPKVEIDWEEWVGKKLLQKLGILIVLVGMIVFLKYSFDNGIIGILGRIAMSAAFGVLLLGAGEFFQKKYAQWSYTFTGAGLVMLMFTVWAARVFYYDQLLSIYGISVSSGTAFGLYAAITLLGAVAAVRYKSEVIAWFSVLGGYLTPILIDSSSANAIGLTVYLAILTSGLFVLAWKGGWKRINVAAFLFTQFYLVTQVYDASFELVNDRQQALIAIGFFLLFGLLPYVYQVGMGKRAQGHEIFLIVTNGIVTTAALIEAIGGFSSSLAAFVLFGLAAVYLVLAGSAIKRIPDDLPLVNTYILGAVTLVALALYAQMGIEWVAAGWAPLSVLVLAAAVVLKRGGAWWCASILLLAAMFLLLTQMPFVTAIETWRPFLSPWAIKSYVVFVSLVGWVKLTSMLPEELIQKQGRTTAWNVVQFLMAAILFLGVTFESTGLVWGVTLALTISYLVLAGVSALFYLWTRSVVWFGFTLLLHMLAFIFVFFAGETSGMMLFSTATVPAIIHPWAGVSLLSLTLTGGLFFFLLKPDHVSFKAVRGWLLAMGFAQVWLHVSVELRHIAAALEWSPILEHRVITMWWILFALAILIWGIERKREMFVKAGMALLVIPFIHDGIFLLMTSTLIWEAIVWALICVGLSWYSAHKKHDQLVTFSTALTFLAAAYDMLTHAGSSTGFLRSLLWAFSALILMSAGFHERNRTLRRNSIIIFCASALMIMLFVFSVVTNTGMRILTTIGCGLLMIGASYLYQRFSSVLDSSSSK